MLLHIPNVLTVEERAICNVRLENAEWGDGRMTAGPQSATVKNNQQLPETSEDARALGRLVVLALERNPTFLGAALPRHVFPPLFNRYGEGMGFGTHIDNALRQIPGMPHRIRTDLSATLFLSDPDHYDGGELVIEDTYGAQKIKLPAGDMVLYPASSLHKVEPITRGARLAAFFWVQSLVRDDSARALLYDLDNAIRVVGYETPGSQALVSLTGCYHNLMRRWADV